MGKGGKKNRYLLLSSALSNILETAGSTIYFSKDYIQLPGENPLQYCQGLSVCRHPNHKTDFFRRGQRTPQQQVLVTSGPSGEASTTSFDVKHGRRSRKQQHKKETILDFDIPLSLWTHENSTRSKCIDVALSTSSAPSSSRKSKALSEREPQPQASGVSARNPGIFETITTPSLQRTQMNAPLPPPLSKGARTNTSPEEMSPAPLSKMGPIILPLNTGLVGSSTKSGQKHDNDESRNEDSGVASEMDVRIGPALYRIRAAWIFDGHGPDQIQSIRSPGRLVSKMAATVSSQIIGDYLQDLIKLPLLPQEHSDFLESRRQALFSQALNEIQKQVVKSLTKCVTDHAGCTATSLIAISDDLSGRDNANDSPVTVMCSNLGDSKAIAVTLKREPHQLEDGKLSYAFTPESVFTLTVNENIREKHEKEWVLRSVGKHGFKQAAVRRVGRFPLEAVLVPNHFSESRLRHFEPFHSLKDVIEAVRHAKQDLPKKRQLNAFAIQGGYLHRVKARGFPEVSSLQVGYTPFIEMSAVVNDIK